MLPNGFFSDESEGFRSPVEPGICQDVTIRLRVEKDVQAHVALLVGSQLSKVPLARVREDDLFAWHEATLHCGLNPFTYRFLVECEGESFVYQKSGLRPADKALPAKHDFRVVPGFRTPEWAKGALQYQIFPDRFANGDPENDVVDSEYAYDDKHIWHMGRWDALPEEDDYRCFYGGDLQGVLSKLDYLQSLGVEAIYLNPIFVSPSSHKYDTQDFEHIDPHLAVIVEDAGSPLEKGETDNAKATRYIARTTSKVNLDRSDELFAQLCGEIHRRGMRIILDGVFNHCGSFSRWMDREGIYRHANVLQHGEQGAFQTPDSPYRHFFTYKDGSTSNYESWWGVPTLPKLNYENAPDLQERILAIAQKWALPPYSIDGWRLDVAADLGHSEEFNHTFWRRFRTELKRVNPELLIVAEHYGDASSWLEGDQWDTVMNYDAFMEPITFFLTGMEKHSDARKDDLYQDGEAFWKAMRANMARFGWGSLLCAMNELSNHDHSRFLTRTNRTVGRLNTAGSAAASTGVDKRVLREAIVAQMCWPGAPTIYYGDEAGQVGWTDPDSRRTYPWGREDKELVELHRALARLRDEHPCLRSGSFAPLGGGHGWIAFGRFTEDANGATADRVAVVCNNLDHDQVLSLRLRTIGVPDGSEIEAILATDEGGHAENPAKVGKVKEGSIEVAVHARSAIVLA